MVSLKYYLAVLRRTAACTEAFEFLSNSCQICVLLVYAIYYRRWFAKLPCFKPYPDALLLFSYFNTSAQIFR